MRALKHEASIRETSAVWNNMGVAYCRLDDSERAYKAFNQAKHVANTPNRDYFLAARNLAQVWVRRSEKSDLLKFTSAVLEEDADNLCLSEAPLTDLYAFHMHALRAVGKVAASIKEGRRVLSSDIANPLLKAWVIAAIVGMAALSDERGERLAIRFIEENGAVLNAIRAQFDPKHVMMLYNNIAFAYADAGELAEAERWISKIAGLIHKDPYTTATLGLIDMRKGNVQRATHRYREAIGLAMHRSDKRRIRQKMDIELGKYWISSEPDRAQRYFEHAAGISDGESLLQIWAAKVISQAKVLPQSPPKEEG
jgi:tetratricopeptide (TPR) repeat protein